MHDFVHHFIQYTRRKKNTRLVRNVWIKITFTSSFFTIYRYIIYYKIHNLIVVLDLNSWYKKFLI